MIQASLAKVGLPSGVAFDTGADIAFVRHRVGDSRRFYMSDPARLFIQK